MRNSSSWFKACGSVAAVAALAIAAVAVSSGQGSSVLLGIPGRTSANPSIAAAGRFVAVAWGSAAREGETDVFVAVSRDAGATFGAPSRVNDTATRASLSGEQPPRIALVPRVDREPSLQVMWTAKAPAGTRLVAARSEDAGRSFASPVPVPGSAAAGNRGWEAMAIHPDGHAVAVWLDHRELIGGTNIATAAEHSEHQHSEQMPQEADGVARAQLSKLFFARLDRPDSARVITGGVCYCCKTAVATGTDGAIYAAWRHVYPGNIRDIAFTVSRDDGVTFAPPVRVSDDRWVLDGCPENGPALAVDDSNQVHIVWPTLVPDQTAAGEPTLGLFYSMSADGRVFTPRYRVETQGIPRHPQIAFVGRSGVAAVWDEQVDGTRRVVAAIARHDNQAGISFTRVELGDRERGEYPVVTGLDTGFLAAWTSGQPSRSAIRVERIRLP